MLSAFGLNCTLKRDNEPSSTEKLLDQCCAHSRATA